MKKAQLPTFNKVLVANRGEIAVRAFRAAYEIGADTVAVYPVEDRNSLHRSIATQAYKIGAEGSPVKAYLDIDEVLRVARKSGADAVYPGYGFLSENAQLSRECAENGITFIGPSPEVLELTGDKAAAVAAARRAGLPTLEETAATDDIAAIVAHSHTQVFPLFVKAVAGS